MIVFIVVMIYTILIVMVPATRIGNFFIIHIHDANLEAFILGMGLLFGLAIYFLQKCLWEPVSIYLRKKYPEKTWLWLSI